MNYAVTVIKAINVSPPQHKLVKVGAADADMTMQDYADKVVQNGAIIQPYLPEGIGLGDFLAVLQKSLKCTDKEDLFKLIWVKLGNEWPPNIEAK